MTQTFLSHGHEMICQPVTLSGYAEWPKVADAVIEAQKTNYEKPMILVALDPTWVKNHACYDELMTYGAIAA